MLEIVDAHAHIGPWFKFYVLDGGIEGFLSVMDHLGIKYAVVTPHAGIVGMLDLAIRQSERAYAESDGRMISYVVYDPHSIEKSLRIIRESLSQPYFAGVKIHPTQHDCPADDERYRPVWEFAHEEKLVMLTHTWDRSTEHPAQNNSCPELFEKYIAQYSDARVILGHAGGKHNAHVACAKLGKAYPNVYVDMAGDGFALGRLKYFIAELSSKRILYGSDAPWIDPRLFLAEILGADITDDDRENILCRNAIDLFNLQAGQRPPQCVTRDGEEQRSRRRSV